MKMLGIIGGIGPGSTVDYYQTIIELYRARIGDGSYPPILINSIDVQRVLATVGAGELKALTDWLLTELQKLEYIHEKYMSELVGGVFLPETRAGLLAIV